MVPISMVGMNIRLQSLRVLSNGKVFAGRSNTTDYVDPHVTQLGQKGVNTNLAGVIMDILKMTFSDKFRIIFLLMQYGIHTSESVPAITR